ncbi:hypothetical protein [Methylomonas sp. CM2]|uniref:hypothetical protein n=1 Tax=Methylomonas sp. CM2 TaxID=3417647 RepID=UPI003CFB84AC
MTYSRKGLPNRRRVDKCRRATGLATKKLRLVEALDLDLDLEAVNAIRPHLASEFRDLEPSLLGWQRFWIEPTNSA